MEYISDIKTDIESLKLKAKLLIKTLDSVNEALDFVNSTGDSEDNKNLISHRMRHLYREIMINYEAMYKIAHNFAYYSYPQFNIDDNPLVKDWARHIISVTVEGNEVLIKMPYLPHRKNRTSRLFSRELYARLLELEKSDKLPHFDGCIIVFTNVYNSSYPSNWYIDNDNVDTKSTIDIITDFMSGSDGAINTVIINQSIVDDNLDSGTYIHITDNDRQNQEILPDKFCRVKLKKILPDKKST